MEPYAGAVTTVHQWSIRWETANKSLIQYVLTARFWCTKWCIQLFITLGGTPNMIFRVLLHFYFSAWQGRELLICPRHTESRLDKSPGTYFQLKMRVTPLAFKLIRISLPGAMDLFFLLSYEPDRFPESHNPPRALQWRRSNPPIEFSNGSDGISIGKCSFVLFVFGNSPFFGELVKITPHWIRMQRGNVNNICSANGYNFPLLEPQLLLCTFSI